MASQGINYFQVTALEKNPVIISESVIHLCFGLFVCLFFKAVIEYHQLNTAIAKDDLSELSRGDILAKSRPVWLKFSVSHRTC